MATMIEQFKKHVLDGMSAGLYIAEQMMREDSSIVPTEEQECIMKDSIALLEEYGYSRNEEGRYVKAP